MDWHIPERLVPGYAELYSRTRCFPGIDGPFIPWVARSEKNKTPRIAIVGQETLGWVTASDCSDFHDFTEKTRKAHHDFDYAEGRDFARSRRSPFWRMHREIAEKVGQNYREVLWLNLSRFDGSKTTKNSASVVYGASLSGLVAAQKGILSDELRVYEVDVAIFLTGPNYDFLIASEFEDVKFKAVNDVNPIHHLAWMSFDAGRPMRALRACHPGYLNRNKRERWVPTMEAVLKLITHQA